MNQEYIFILFAIIIIGSALFVLWSKNVVYSAFMLFFTFIGVAAVFVLAMADFLAVAQIMVYIGGILILLVFGVLLTNKTKKVKMEQLNTISTDNQNMIFGFIIGISLLASFLYLFKNVPFERFEGINHEFYEAPKSIVQSIGINLIAENSIPFEAVGLLLVGALIGAGYIAKSTIDKV